VVKKKEEKETNILKLNWFMSQLLFFYSHKCIAVMYFSQQIRKKSESLSGYLPKFELKNILKSVARYFSKKWKCLIIFQDIIVIWIFKNLE